MFLKYLSLKNVIFNIFIKIRDGAKIPNHGLGHFMFCYVMHTACRTAWISGCRQISMDEFSPPSPLIVPCSSPGLDKELYAAICEKPIWRNFSVKHCHSIVNIKDSNIKFSIVFTSDHFAMYFVVVHQFVIYFPYIF